MTLFVKKCQRMSSLCIVICHNTPTSIKLTRITVQIIRKPFPQGVELQVTDKKEIIFFHLFYDLKGFLSAKHQKSAPVSLTGADSDILLNYSCYAGCSLKY
ncbi:protein of unknown function [Maridesulfovibrio hydrothermalis AM13 = DSM 14728]|uniref:Uncharacterized protein n=1 Tax=Maridesulfovibrio hydrothermalis AM13 = DSM 14728 TaxID=1121451 RepID=L0R887_9BACT|nr:protein of unknown function [Maridesulfovibrio hydrothermalis AM13 = DSM 14728]